MIHSPIFKWTPNEYIEYYNPSIFLNYLPIILPKQPDFLSTKPKTIDSCCNL